MAIEIGIYMITNLKNGKRYVGSSVNIPRRITQHLWQLRKGVHPNQELQTDFNASSSEAFQFETIVSCRAEDLSAIENCLIIKYATIESGYNTKQELGPRKYEVRLEKLPAKSHRPVTPQRRKQLAEQSRKYWSNPANRRKASERAAGPKRPAPPKPNWRERAFGYLNQHPGASQAELRRELGLSNYGAMSVWHEWQVRQT